MVETVDTEQQDHLKANLRGWFSNELERAERDITRLDVVHARARRRRPGSAPSLVATLLAVGVVFVVALRVIPIGAPASSATPGQSAPSGSPATVTAWYPDGVPMAIDGEHVFRPGTLAIGMAGTTILVGGWDVGPLGIFCPEEVIGESAPPCGAVEGLAERKGGPRVSTISWDEAINVAFPIVVLRAEVMPLPSCLSDPPGGCPTQPYLHGTQFVWQGGS
jgi:hypothetical protein